MKQYSIEQMQALTVRREFGIDPLVPIEDIVSIIRKQGITVVKKTIEKSKISGMCSKHKDGTYAIMVNKKYSLGRQNFTLAHELYHLKFDEELSKTSPATEKSANKFASYFLMPQEALGEELFNRNINKKNQVTIEDALYLSNYFKVSYTAILVRLRYEEKIIDQIKFEELSKVDIVHFAFRNGYNTELYEPTYNNDREIFSNYVELANKALNNDKISIGKYEEYLIEGGFEDIVFGLEKQGGPTHDGNFEDYI